MYRGDVADKASGVACRDLEKDVLAALNILKKKLQT